MSKQLERNKQLIEKREQARLGGGHVMEDNPLICIQ